MDKNIKGIEKMGKWMDKENLLRVMEELIKVSFGRVIERGLEFIIDLMDQNIKEIEKREKNRGKVCELEVMEVLTKVSTLKTK